MSSSCESQSQPRGILKPPKVVRHPVYESGNADSSPSGCKQPEVHKKRVGWDPARNTTKYVSRYEHRTPPSSEIANDTRNEGITPAPFDLGLADLSLKRMPSQGDTGSSRASPRPSSSNKTPQTRILRASLTKQAQGSKDKFNNTVTFPTVYEENPRDSDTPRQRRDRATERPESGPKCTRVKSRGCNNCNITWLGVKICYPTRASANPGRISAKFSLLPPTLLPCLQ